MNHFLNYEKVVENQIANLATLNVFKQNRSRDWILEKSFILSHNNEIVVMPLYYERLK